MAWAASSIRTRLCLLAMACNASIWHGCPYKWTGMIALVWGETAVSTATGSIFNVPGNTSTKTGVACWCSTTFAVAANVIVGTITSSPGPIPSAASATCRPAVHELTATAYDVPTKSANCRSNAFVLGPVVSQPEASVSTTSPISASLMSGLLNGKNSVRALFISTTLFMHHHW